MKAISKRRAERFLALLELGPRHGQEHAAHERQLDNCLEMGDGDDVYRAIMARADADPWTAAMLFRKGFACWLAPDYRQRYAMPAAPDLFAQTAAPEVSPHV